MTNEIVISNLESDDNNICLDLFLKKTIVYSDNPADNNNETLEY